MCRYSPPATEWPAYRQLNTSLPLLLQELFEAHCSAANQPVVSFYASTDMARPDLYHYPIPNIQYPMSNAQYQRITCPPLNVTLLHLLQVFDGSRPPYGPSDAVSPLSIYGETKVESEGKLKGRALVGRLPLMYGLGGGFFQVMVDTLRANKPLHLFNDEWRSMAWVTQVAELIVDIIAHFDRFDLSKVPHCFYNDFACKYNTTQHNTTVFPFMPCNGLMSCYHLFCVGCVRFGTWVDHVG